MRPAVLSAAVLLPSLVLVLVQVQDVAGVPTTEIQSRCLRQYPVKPCRTGGGWSQMTGNKCFKFQLLLRNFWEAESHCVRLGAHLVSIHNSDDLSHVLCSSMKTKKRQPTTGDHFWIGGKGAAPTSGYSWTDGSQFNFTWWYDREPDNRAAHVCVEMNYKNWGKWNNVNCDQKRKFVCMKTV